ncbi:MAG: ABC transporter ATP-binding protein [Clostridia bacterium]|nr:ABC transporter ATP-binding protein [Clostridia bacterium]
MYAIKTEALTKFYGKSRGIENVDLAVESGDFFGFIGPNGAGKSTTIRTLLGLIAATSGRAEILGREVLENKTELLREIGYLPSETAFYNGMKVKDMLSLSARLRGVNCTDEAKKLADRLELDTDRRIDELSLGNRKKVGIVCALQHKPALYILDEPTSGLDPLMQREFYSILKERNDEGATIFLSSHILSEVSRYCKHAAVIREGRIIVTDSIERLGHTGVKRVSLKGISVLPEIEGSKDIVTEDENISFLYSGDEKALLKRLCTLDFSDINISDPDLDEIFMHYYM